ncbi:MAG TPA: hypothetical protein VJN96_02755 [Vicinamibacterales bacterium]|nr:hypothetical protein [Vicinamibacterales bacterium]
MTHWFHLKCAALRRPEPVIETLESTDVAVADKDELLREAKLGVTYRRLPRVNAAGRAATGRANCRHCREPIVKDAWRISLVYYEDGRFMPSGFVHLSCVAAYFETTDVMGRVKHFSPGLTGADLEEIRSQIG